MIPESGVPNLPRLRELVRVVRDASRRWRMVATGTKLAALAGARDQNSSASIEQVMASLQRLRDEESGSHEHGENGGMPEHVVGGRAGM
jgi:hypothetical protein